MLKERLVGKGPDHRHTTALSEQGKGGRLLHPIDTCRRHVRRLIQDNGGDRDSAPRKRFQREQHMVDAADGRTSDNDHRQTELLDQIPHIRFV
jgi:hypothetical protein